MKKYFKITAISAVLLLVIFMGVMLSGYSEGYCFFYPSIDTVYAKGYSETNFFRITHGMTRSDVDALMCLPLGIGTNKDGTVTYGYTKDGKCKWGDFAWFGRMITFSNDVVVAITSTIYMD